MQEEKINPWSLTVFASRARQSAAWAVSPKSTLESYGLTTPSLYQLNPAQSLEFSW